MSKGRGDYVYRYRPIKSALHEHHELENDHIYFSTTEELNDPLEGFRDLFWQGDEIVWRNLLKHYFLCALDMFNYCLAAGTDFDPAIIKSIVFLVPQALPEAPIREIYKRLSDSFLGEPAVTVLVKILSSRGTPVRRNELSSYLRPLHGLAMRYLIEEYRARGLLLPRKEGEVPPSREKVNADTIKMTESVTKISPSEFPPERISEALFGVNEATIEQLLLINELNMPDREQRMAITYFANHFPSAYVAALEKLVHRDWYVGCFSPKPDDPMMWSNYGGGHRGICLIFKPDKKDGKSYLPLEQINGMNGKGEYLASYVPHEISPVTYTRTFPPIDFFRSFGVLPEPHISGFWYRSDDGQFSSCLASMNDDRAAWMETYWDQFSKNALCKTPEWEHEGESRIVFHTGFDAREKPHRKLKYKFENLVGIVFGANTNFEDRLQICRIVDGKCQDERRKEFRFYEMRYLHTEGRFQLFPLDLLKLTS